MPEGSSPTIPLEAGEVDMLVEVENMDVERIQRNLELTTSLILRQQTILQPLSVVTAWMNHFLSDQKEQDIAKKLFFKKLRNICEKWLQKSFENIK